MPDPTHFSPNSPAGQAPTPDHRRHAHSASPKVLSEVEGLRDPIKPSPVKLSLRYAEGPEHFDCAQYKLRRGATGRSRDVRLDERSRLAALAGRTMLRQEPPLLE